MEEKKEKWSIILIILLLVVILFAVYCFFLKGDTKTLRETEKDNPSTEQDIKVNDSLVYYEFEYPEVEEKYTKEQEGQKINKSKTTIKKYNLGGTEVFVNIETRFDAEVVCDFESDHCYATSSGADLEWSSNVTINGKKFGSGDGVEKLDNNYIMIYSGNSASCSNNVYFINKNGDVSKKIHYNCALYDPTDVGVSNGRKEFKINIDENNNIIGFTYYLNNSNDYKDRLDLSYFDGKFGEVVKTSTDEPAEGEVVYSE